MNNRAVGKTLRAMATAVGAVAGLFLIGDVDAQTCTPDFLITPTPNGPQYNRLKAVTAFDVNDVWAVGFTNGWEDQTLTEHWDGSSWTIVPSPNQGVLSELSGVGGIATDDLWAVGSFVEDVGFHPPRTLTEHWDGAQWSVVPSPSLQGFDQLNAVAAVATDDVWAVGQDSLPNPLFLHWDGQAWSIIDAPPDAGPQFAVAAIASNDVWSAGSGRRASNTALFNHWDGTSWSTIPNPPLAPGFADIKGLSATASNDVWAVGSLSNEVCDKTCYYFENPSVLHWDGQSWAIVRPPMAFGLSRLSGTAAESSASVWGVGSEIGRTIASHWDGSRWTNAPSIELGAGTIFEGVAVIGGDAWAVGWFAIPNRDQTFAVRFRCN
jgi:hypothetical protein